MRPLVLLLGALVLLTPATACDGGAVIHASGVPGFVDEFDGIDGLDEARWERTAHDLGRSRLDPARVGVAGGALSLRLSPGSTDGAELRTRALLGDGTFRARLRAPDAPDSLTGFFLYAAPDGAHEIDVELFGDPAGRVKFTTWAGGDQTHSVDRDLGFDPTAGAHDYEITRRAGVVAFRVDGRALVTWSDGVPREPLHLYLNAWFPRWLGGSPPRTPQATVVERVEVLPD
ncbi:glycoside hydrolase family 16 protein [Actinomycetospora rhizophila]|uniref:Glycoside hydrolase family 16 protein n=1 Tax=Actinomycetospora rhizophila TaxID=1416876 RepID=A0ABV9Z970_9PSEU